MRRNSDEFLDIKNCHEGRSLELRRKVLSEGWWKIMKIENAG